MIHAVLNATGGLGHAWILNAFDPAALVSGATALITLVFMVVFVILAVVLMLYYISRLMLLAFGAAVSPFIFLLWLLPKTSDFAESSIKAYVVTIFSLFVHVVIIQLASAFLTIPDQVGANPFISVLIGIALFMLLLKSTSMILQLALASQSMGMMKKLGSQVMNVISPAVPSAPAATVIRTSTSRVAPLPRRSL
mgnify:CR=1 FL=1